MIEGPIFNQYTGKCGNNPLRIGHDIYLSWYLLIGKEWKFVSGGTKKEAQHAAHQLLHEGERCGNRPAWELDSGTRAQVLGECVKCLNPSLESDLKTYRKCNDCGWELRFTPEEIEWLENRIKQRR